MSSIKVNCGKIDISNNDKICIISGPCQLESEQHAMDMAGKIKEITSKFGLGFIYKTSFDKANRTSLKGKRGAGLEASLPVFDKIKKELNVPILTDIHNAEQCAIVSKHVDVLQIPAFLCRQTDLLIAAAKTNKIINVKNDNLLQHNCEKKFHVSPFIEMNCSYFFRILKPADKISVIIDQYQLNEKILYASQDGKRKDFTTSELIKSYLKHPLMTFKIIAAIHFEAFKLWTKGIKFIQKKLKIRNNISFEN